MAVLKYAIAQGFDIPSGKQLQLYNQFMLRALKNAWFQEHDVFYLRVNDAGPDWARINWVSPGDHSSVLMGDATWTSNAGISGTVNGYIRNGWQNDVNNVHYQLEDSAQWVYAIPSNNSTLQPLFYQSALSGSNTQMYLDSIGSSYSRFNVNAGSPEQPKTFTASNRLFMLLRDNNTQYQIIHDASSSTIDQPPSSLSGGNFDEMILSSSYANIPFYASGAASSQFNRSLMQADLEWLWTKLGATF